MLGALSINIFIADAAIRETTIIGDQDESGMKVMFILKRKFWVKGIVQPFELGSETRLIRSAVINWRPARYNFF
jgi:hypothetical protein